MIEVKFTGETAADVRSQMEDFLGSEGATVKSISKTADKPTKDTKPKVSLDEVKEKTGDFVGRGPDQKASVKKLLAEHKVARVTDLEPAEYGDFLASLAKLVEADDEDI